MRGQYVISSGKMLSPHSFDIVKIYLIEYASSKLKIEGANLIEKVAESTSKFILLLAYDPLSRFHQCSTWRSII
jgi:hypothetical protein